MKTISGNRLISIVTSTNKYRIQSEQEHKGRTFHVENQMIKIPTNKIDIRLKSIKNANVLADGRIIFYSPVHEQDFIITEVK